MISISHNPFKSFISITCHKQFIKQVTCTIKTTLGQIVFSDLENNYNDKYTQTYDLNFLPNGIYLLDIIIDGERTVKKIVKS
jgi:hypothetical protein